MSIDTVASRRALVVTVSDRSSAGTREDRSGPVAVSALRDRGWIADAVVTPDGEAVRSVLLDAVAADYSLVVTTGGTGLAARDLTPEITADVVDRLVPGIPELLRADGQRKTPTAILSRGIAGSVGGTLVVNLAGSPGAVTDAMRVLFPAIDHAVEHLRGNPDHGDDHTTGDAESAAPRPGEVLLAETTAEPIALQGLEALVSSSECGAVVGFAGVIRNHDHGRQVASVEYTAHPSAGDVIAAVAESVAVRLGVGRLAAAHRIGCQLAVGETALACAVAAAHRAEAFAGCRDLVESIKRELPVWKRQVLVDGTVEWVNCP